MIKLLPPRTIGCHHRHPGNVLLVKNKFDHMVVHASLDDLSVTQRDLSTHAIAIKGFIPELSQYYFSPGSSMDDLSVPAGPRAIHG